ncbi:hypothetical protein OV203_14755 [Nannocystis sp. ILAH1]|uniref:hypothetical protein n=1 Tax=unclassified Nannocystis TaxID=2627009 RepID=UPI002271E51C|nr:MULTISPECIES: hypothetical protein [unclassified Nannocystis]MCY0988390.1 hypothetical protein [Nannocystis sp. ILAH1]MCY1067649.1 hypothetical protein [Nannocystis sp. RBIL2]
MRTLLSLVFLVAILWASCTVKLGAYTLSEHVDRIGETPQAKELLDGTRGRISPMLEDMKQRIFGEYVEAPTRATNTKEPTGERRRSPPRPSQAAVRSAPPPEPPVARERASSPNRGPSSADDARLPGTRQAALRRGEQ